MMLERGSAQPPTLKKLMLLRLNSFQRKGWQIGCANILIGSMIAKRRGFSLEFRSPDLSPKRVPAERTNTTEPYS
jgi:hypothetical protein